MGHTAPMDGAFLFAKQSPPANHYARVAVTVELGPNRRATIAPDAFSWLLDEIGPNARVPSADHPCALEATAGALFGLDDAGLDGHVLITDIQWANADTGPGDIAYATAFAVWDALGHIPATPPTVHGATIDFPTP